MNGAKGYPTPPVFCTKSAQAVENKRRARRKKPQESSRVRKRLGGKEIEELKEGRSARFVLDNTGNGTTVFVFCQ